MSFGFSVSDFITVIQLAFKIRKEFASAPSQFKAVSDEVRTLSFVLQDAEVALQTRELNNEQKRDLEEVYRGCRNILDELQGILDKNSDLSSESEGVGSRIKRVWKRLNWKPEDINELRSLITTNISFLNAFNGRLTQDNVVKLVRHQEDQGRQKLLDWLTLVDFATQQNDFFSRREEGTGQWLLESAELQEWVKTDQQVLFCPGIPGAGKTILTSVVVNYLYTKFQKDSSIGIAYLYCNFRRQNEQNIEGLLASLLKQLAQGLYHLPESIKSLYNNHNKNQTRPAFSELSTTLQSVATLYSRSFIVVDALDECQTSGGCRTKLMTEIFALQSKSRANIFSTSRFIREIEVQFKNSMRLEIQASDHDVQRYLDSHISELPTCVLRNSELQGEIKAAIVKAVNGMFLLAQLYFDSLKGKKSPKAIRTALKELSTGNDAYNGAYNNAMERIDSQLAGEKELANRVLSWITCAKRLLTTSELEHALAVEFGESQFDKENLSPIEDIVSVCAGLVTVNEESAIIRLVHYTTQEYFERTQKHWFPQAETDIAEICIIYLSFNNFETGICQNDEEFDERLQSNPLYDYAAQNWGHHARNASTLIQEVIIFLEKRAQVEASIQALFAREAHSENLGYIQIISGYSQVYTGQMTGLHLAAYFGLKDVVNSSLEAGLSAHLKDSSGRTPLSWASEKGHEATAKLLLAKGAEVNAKDKDDRTPLSWVAMKGQEAVAKLLLDKGAKVDTKDKSGQTPLSLAAVKGHKAVAKLLLDKGAKLDIKNKYGWMPLSWAAMNGQEAVAVLLINEGAEVNAKDNYGQTMLFWAAMKGREAIAKLLLDNGAKVDAKDMFGHTPLYWAAVDGQKAVAELLLDKGAKVDAKNKSGRTPLSVAAMKGHEAAAKLLLAKGAEVNAKDKDGRTPLSWAAMKGQEAVAKLLLDEGAEVDAKDGSSRTPLFLAAENGHEMVEQLLLRQGALVVEDLYGLVALFRL